MSYVGVEGDLVPLVGELLGEREPRFAAVLLAGVGIATEVVVVVPPLEVLVRADHVVHLGAHVGRQDLGGDLRVVRDAHGLADVVAQRRDHHLVVGARAFGEGRRLEAVRELIDREAVGDAASDRSIASTVSATRPWCSNVSLPICSHCSAVDSSMRVKVEVMAPVSQAPLTRVSSAEAG